MGEVLSVSGGGTPSTHNSDYWHGEIPWLTPAEVSGFSSRFIDKTGRNISKQGLKHSSAKLMPEDSLLLTSRATIGDVVINKVPMATNQGFINIEPSSEVDQMFLFYWLKRNHDYFNQIAVGSTFPELIKSVFKEIEIELPSLTDQKRIANILSAFDDKIELNNKISQTLEQMAQAIFKEWFVNFKFPGHEKVKMVDSELGKIPEGWEVKSLDEIANFLNGLALQKYRPSNDRDVLPVIKIREMNNGIDKNTELASSSIDEKYKVKAGDILFSWSGSLELMRWTERTGALNQHLFKVTSENYPNWFFYYWIQRHLSFFRVVASGKATSMGHIQRHHLSEALVVVPRQEILDKANDLISPMFKNILELRMENQKLFALRDLLLPKLMSGEIKV